MTPSQAGGSFYPICRWIPGTYLSSVTAPCHALVCNHEFYNQIKLIGGFSSSQCCCDLSSG